MIIRRIQHLVLVLVCATAGISSLSAQDPVFSQFYSAPLQLNPALAGIVYAPNFSINYRNQWPSLNSAYQTYAVSYDQFFRDYNSGVGIYVQSDNAGNGIIRTNKASVAYSYRVRVSSSWELRLGIEAGMLQTRLDWSKLVFPDQLDPQFGAVSPGGTPIPSEENQPDDLNKTYFDIGAGGLVYNENFYVGFTMKHLNTPGQRYLAIDDNLANGLPIRWSVHVGGEFDINMGNNRFWRPFISPNAMFVSQGASRQLNIGTFIGFGQVYGGVWYRHANLNPDAIIGAFGFKSSRFRITYSYDATISKLSLSSGGSHEIGVGITLDDKNRESKYNDCFSIFR